MAFRKTLAIIALAAGAAFAEKTPPDLVHPYASLETADAPGPLIDSWHRERLDYDIYWGIMYVGSAYLQVDRVVTVDGNPAYHIVSGAESAALISKFYKVLDVNESWMDTAGLFSYGYYKNIREGGYRLNEWVMFDVSSGTFRGERMNKKREISSMSGSLPGQVNDVLSALYLVRAMRLEPGSSTSISVNSKKNWTMSVKARERDKESTAYGKFDCIIVEPQVGDEGLFVAKEGKKMLVWITDDELRLPLKLKAEIFIGSVTAKLVKRTVE